jgi:hypothetical protein
MMNHRLLLLREERIMIPGECVPFGHWEERFGELKESAAREGRNLRIWWWAHEAEKRGLPALYCEAWYYEGYDHMFIKALQPAHCFPEEGRGNDIPGILLPYRKEPDKELYLRITDLLKEISEFGLPEMSSGSYYPEYDGLEGLDIPEELRLELIQCASLAEIHERLLPLLKQEVDALHSTEYLLGLLRGDMYLRPDAE